MVAITQAVTVAATVLNPVAWSHPCNVIPRKPSRANLGMARRCNGRKPTLRLAIARINAPIPNRTGIIVVGLSSRKTIFVATKEDPQKMTARVTA
jgi:hypothetical protein